MIIVSGSIVARPETIDELRELGLAHSRRSRSEAGCEQHTLHVDVENRLPMVFVERWADRSALLTHFRDPNARAFVAQVRKLAAEPPTISIYSGEEVRFADFIAS